MKHLIYAFTLSLILWGCGDSSDNTPSDIVDDNSEIVLEEEIIDEEFPEEDFAGVDTKQIIYAEIGLYGESAIMSLDWAQENDYGHIPVTGYYFYVKHQKNLDLEGYANPGNHMMHLTESYKGKESGYMEFRYDIMAMSPMDENFWSVAQGEEDKQEIKVKELIFTDPMDANIALNWGKNENPHEILFYMGEEEGEVVEEVVDELNWTTINDRWFAFDIHVTGRNAHLGAANGITELNGNTAVWIAENDECQLTFTIEERGEYISVEEKDCDYYHGFHARFDGTFFPAE